MPRTIPDEEYAFLQNKRVTADFIESIYNDPALNKDAKRLIKRKYPQLAIPDLDIEDKVQSQLDAERKKREDAEAAAKRKADDEHWLNQRKKVQADYSFTDEGMVELENFMREKGVGDYEVAATYRASKNPRASEPTYDSHFWHHDQAPDFKKIAADPESWGRGEILAAINRDQERARGR